MSKKGRSWPKRWPEFLLMAGGLGLLVAFFAADLWAQAERAEGIARFAEERAIAKAAPADPTSAPTAAEVAPATVPAVPTPAPNAALALLRIPKVELEVPVYAGTEESVLRRGAGLIEGTADPGTQGNVGIAAHRDRDFRPLQHVQVGDVIELETATRIHVYRVTNLSVVEPADVHVLDDAGEAALTLVTCFPFYFVGNAPQRYIVRAVAVDDSM